MTSARLTVSGLLIVGPHEPSLSYAGSASRWHPRTHDLLPVTGGDLAHGLRVRRFAWGNGCKVCRGLAEELLDAGRSEEQQHAPRVGIHHEAVCDSAWAVHEGPRAHVGLLIAEPEPNLAFKHYEEFVVATVDMNGRSETSWAPELDSRKLTPRLIRGSFADKTPAADESVRLAFVGMEHVSVGLVSRKRHVLLLLSPSGAAHYTSSCTYALLPRPARILSNAPRPNPRGRHTGTH